MLTADDVQPEMPMRAVNMQCVVFNVDYRLGPVVRCPKGQ